MNVLNMNSKPRQGRHIIAVGVSPRYSADNYTEPRRGDTPSPNLVSPLRGFFYCGTVSVGLRPRLTSAVPYGDSRSKYFFS